MSDPSSPELAALLAPELAAALDFILQLAYATGWAHAQGERGLSIDHPELEQRLAAAALAWQARSWAPRPALPDWLEQEIARIKAQENERKNDHGLRPT